MTKKTKPLPLCPIPEDAKKGDILVCRDGTRRPFVRFDSDGDVRSDDICWPSSWRRSGEHVSPHAGAREADIVQFIRTKPAKPKVDRDAAWLRKIADHDPYDDAYQRRVKGRYRRIAARLDRYINGGVMPC